MKITRYLWYVPALYVAAMFGEKIIEGLGHSPEFIAMIGVVSPLKPYAYSIAPIVGIFDFCIGMALLLNPLVTKNRQIQTFLFVWTMLWPFLPGSLRYFGGVAEFEIIEVLSISLSSLLAYVLWKKFSAPSYAR